MRIFLGVGRLHPKVSLLVEMGVLPLECMGSETKVCGILVQGKETRG